MIADEIGTAETEPVSDWEYAASKLLVSNCAELMGFGSGKEAAAAFKKTLVEVRPMGNLRVREDQFLGIPALRPTVDTPAPAQALPASRSTGFPGVIYVNSNFNWGAPENVPALNVSNGTWLYMNYQQMVAGLIGRTALSTSDYHALLLLHEFRHVLGAPQESDPAKFNKEIAEKCL